MFRALVGRGGYHFQKQLKEGRVHFCDGKKGGTIFPFCVFIPTGGALPPGYNGLYAEAPPERGTLSRLEVYKRVGIELPV